MTTLSRRGLMAGTAGAGVIAAAASNVSASQARPDAHPLQNRTLTRIAFGACGKGDKPQPIWDAVLGAEPDLFIFLGDNVYLDTRDPEVMRRKYSEFAAQPGFQRLKATVPILAIWDDHDYGEDDAGVDYPMKEESRRQFLEFFGVPADSPRWTRDGIYASYVFGPEGRRTQIILPDLRWNRTPLVRMELNGQEYRPWVRAKHAAGEPTPGPYVRNPDLAATQLGETQWRWLEHQMSVPADVRIFGSSLQVLADFAGWEGWINFAHDHQRLFATIREQRCNGLICISGDTHYGEISKLDVNTPYTIWDITSSGITEVEERIAPNALRLGEVLAAQNFGMMTIGWGEGEPTVLAQVFDVNGVPKLEQVIRVGDLKV